MRFFRNLSVARKLAAGSLLILLLLYSKRANAFFRTN